MYRYSKFLVRHSIFKVFFLTLPFLKSNHKYAIMKKILIALFALPILAFAQTTATNAPDAAATGGMKFEHALNWTEIQAKAKAENKFIIMDCYTTWCGPCTYMTNN